MELLMWYKCMCLRYKEEEVVWLVEGKLSLGWPLVAWASTNLVGICIHSKMKKSRWTWVYWLKSAFGDVRLVSRPKVFPVAGTGVHLFHVMIYVIKGTRNTLAKQQVKQRGRI